jgi:hypothetical protein
VLWGMAITVPGAVAQEGDAPVADAGGTPGPGHQPPRRGGWPGGRDPNQELDRIQTLHEVTLQEMDLSDQQAQAVDDLFKEYIEAAAEHVKRMEATREKNAAQIEELEDEVAEARRSRDREAMRRLFEELRQATGADGTFAELRSQFFADMMEALGEEQGRAFRRMAGKSMRSSSGLQNSAISDIHVLRRALVQMELPQEQKRAALKHFKGLRERLAEAREQGEVALANLAADLREAVESELDEEQIAALDKAVTETKGQRSRTGRGGRQGATSPHGESADKAEVADEQEEQADED